MSEGVLLKLNTDEDSILALAEHLRSEKLLVLSDPAGKTLTCLESDSSSNDKSRYERMSIVLSRLNQARLPQGSKFMKELADSRRVRRFRNGTVSYPLIVLLRKLHILEDIIPLQTSRDLLQSSVRHVGWLSGSLEQREYHWYRIESYAGPHTSLYFRFMQTYTTWLLIPSIAAVLFEIIRPFSYVQFSPFFLGWSFAFLWLSWQPLRLRHAPDPSDVSPPQQLFAYPSETSRTAIYIRKAISILIFFIVGYLILIILFASLRVRWHLLDSRGELIGQIVYSLVQMIITSQFDMFTRLLATFEKHSDDLGFEKSRLQKSIVIRLISIFAFPIHLALTADNPFLILQNHLATTFTIKQVTSSVAEMLPWLAAGFSASKKKIKPWEGPVWNVNDEYLEMAVQFTTLMAFGFVFPLSFVFAFLNNVLEGHLDAEKLALSKRPLPTSVDVARIWIGAFNLLTVFAASLNLLLIARLGSGELAKLLIITVLIVRAGSYFVEMRVR